MTMQSVMFYFQQFCLFGSSFFLFFVRLFPAEDMDFIFLKEIQAFCFKSKGV